MNTFSKKILYYIVSTMFFVFLFSANVASASNVYGSAWSEGIGWISFNSCTSPGVCPASSNPSHGVTLDLPTSHVSGTAWNSNIGLISFNSTDWGKCPPNKSGCNLSNFQNKWEKDGWARAISVVNGSFDKANSGGWDGWISLGHNSFYNADIDKNTSVNMSSSGFPSGGVFSIKNGSNGYWWGGDVIGWINLNPSGSSPYDVTKGGVFVTNLDQDLILEGPAYVLAGNKANFTWTTKNGFRPVSCIRTSTPGGSNWDQTTYAVSGTSGSINAIEIPHNNNSDNTQTEFKIECTNNTVTQQAVWNVIATKFEPEISFPYSCINKTEDPTLDILNIDEADSPSCDVYADEPTSNRFVGTTTTDSIVDTNFSGEDTNYTMQCTNGVTNIAYYDTPSPTRVAICSPFFSIIGNTRCGTTPFNQKYGGVLVKNGTNYEAEVTLTLASSFGFDTSPVSISSGDSNLVFSPNNFTINGLNYNTINAKYTIDEASYITSTNNAKDSIVVPINLNPSANTSVALNFCPTTVEKIKPIYKPF